MLFLSPFELLQLEELPVAHEMIRRLEQKVENLEAVASIRTDYERFHLFFCFTCIYPEFLIVGSSCFLPIRTLYFQIYI